MRAEYDSVRQSAIGSLPPIALICCVVLFPVKVAAQEANSDVWFQRSLVGMEVGPTGAQFGYSDPNDKRYCARWDGAEIVRRCVGAGAEYLVLWLRDGDFAYYNSKLLPKAPGLGTRDSLREALDEAKLHDLPIISYCVVQQGGIYLQENPQWKMRDAAGNEIARFCYNSGYLEAMKKIVAEQLAYGIEGFHIDMLDQGFGKPYGCWCETCRELFRQKYDRDMPDGATWDQAWEQILEFRYETSERFERQLTAHIKSLDAKATVDFNYHGNPPFSFEVGQRPVQHAGNADFVTGETGVWGFSALGVGLNAEFYRAATPGLPFQVAIQRGVRMYHDQTTRPLNDMRWETLTLLAHGAFVTMIDKTAFDGALDPIAYQRIGKVLSEARDLRKHFGHTPVVDVGLYFSSRTRDWIGKDEPARYFQSFLGAHAACVMEQLQFGVILDENVSLKTLRKFPAVCLPNVSIISEREAGLLREYVRSGGKLLITGNTGQFDSMGQPLEESMLDDLIGARFKGRLASEDNWVSIDKPTDSPTEVDVLTGDLPVDWPFLVKGPAAVYEPNSALAIGKLYKPQRTRRQEEGRMGIDWPMSPDQPVGPAVFINRFGKGTVVTCAGSPDFATGSEHALVENRILFRNLFQMLGTERRIRVDAPSNVEAVVTDDPKSRTLRVHLLAYNPTPRITPNENRPYALPGMIEDKPIFRAAISAAGIVQASSLDSETKIVNDVESDGNSRFQVTVEDIHDLILLQY